LQEKLKGEKAITMIEDLFGKPNLPRVISNCILFFEDEFIYIGKIYIFNNISILDVIKFGEVWVSDRVFNGRKITGYFSTTDRRVCGKDKNPSRIIGKSSKDISCVMEGITFTKINQNILPEYSAQIKFTANIFNEKIITQQSAP
jgi:hypothetical protein